MGGEKLQEAPEPFLSTQMLYSNTFKIITTEDLNPANCLCTLALLKHLIVLIFLLFKLWKAIKYIFFSKSY